MCFKYETSVIYSLINLIAQSEIFSSSFRLSFSFQGIYCNFTLIVQIRCIAIIAEGIPERLTQRLNKMAAAKGVTIIGPATVSFVIFNTYLFTYCK